MHSMYLLSLFLQNEGEAPATTEKTGGGSMLNSIFFPAVLMIGIFYLVLIRPERKKQKAREALLGGMKKGDKVMTTSGIYGTITQIQDEVVTLQVADGVRMRFARAAVQTLLNVDEKAGNGKD